MRTNALPGRTYPLYPKRNEVHGPPGPDNPVSRQELTEKGPFGFFDAFPELFDVEHVDYAGRGSVGEVICRAAGEKDMDLFVIGAGGPVRRKASL